MNVYDNEQSPTTIGVAHNGDNNTPHGSVSFSKDVENTSYDDKYGILVNEQDTSSVKSRPCHRWYMAAFVILAILTLISIALAAVALAKNSSNSGIQEVKNNVASLQQTNKDGMLSLLELKSDVKNLIEIEGNRSAEARRIANESLAIGTDCDEIYNRGYRVDGVYTIIVGDVQMIAYCQFQRNGSNWMVFQRRDGGLVDFYRGWLEYKKGFGLRSAEFWLGLENLHLLTSSRNYILRIDMEDWNRDTAYAEYRVFFVAGASQHYQLTVRDFSGTGGDSLSGHSSQAFTTYDHDADSRNEGNCAVRRHGAWWYNNCYDSNLNGRYLLDGQLDWSGVVWYRWKTNNLSLKRTEMKIRPE